jgi:phenylacetate-CoA ligase
MIRSRSTSTDAGVRVKDLVGVTATIELLEPGRLERSLGKAERILDPRR